MDGVQTAKPVASPSSGPLTPSELSSLSPSALSPEAIHPALLHLSDEEAITICSALLTSRRIEDPRLAKALIDLGFIRADKILSRIEADVRDALGGAQGKWDQWSGEQIRLAMEKVLIGQEGLEPVLRCCVTLHDIKHRLDIYDVIYPPAAKHNERPPLGSLKESVNEQHTGTPMDLDDPWDDGTSDSGAEKQDVPALDDPWEAAGSDVSGSVKSIKVDGQPPPTDTTDLPDPLEPPIPLSTFLAQTLLESSLSVAASALIPALQIIRDRYPSEIYPYRFALLDAMPGWVPPGELESAGLLPQLGDDGREKAWPSAQRMAAGSFLDVLSTEYRAPNHSSLRSPRSQLFSSKELSEWYAQRILSLDSVGLLDVQLGWVQFGASSGVPGLDALGENLSLLSRLIYDANLSPTQQERWNLSSWRAASQGEIVKAYLSGSTAGSIVNDIKRLVLPYLYVLESRAERAGMPDPQLVERLLHDAVLHLRLHLALPVFEASKATLPVGSRLIRKDMNVARLALACLYGSEQREVWATMSAIFECLPVWDVSGGDIEADKEATSTTLESIATFVRPTRAGARPPTAHDLFVFFSPLPFASLSRALDILDVHLESGEILARWETAVQLRFLLQSARNTGDQVELAERMVRRQASRGPHTDTRWTSLWNDMRKLNGGDDALLRGAFGMLSIEQMMRTYVGGVLSSGKIDTAKRMIRRLETEHALSSALLEKVILVTAREFYDNAETGNVNTGDMKLAYDCLSVAPSSVNIRREREFIEATSRLCSYNFSISPIEIRHSRDRLQLIRRVLSSSDDAYRHAEIVLDLTDKLGYRGDTTARVKVLAMLADAAVQAMEFERAFEHCQAMVALAKSRARTKSDEDRVEEVCWKTCLELGHQSEYAEVGNKMTLLGWAIELCPSERIPDILAVWRKVEDGQIRLGEAAKRRRLAGINQPSTSNRTSGSIPSSPRMPEAEERVLGSRTAARAARLAMGLGDRFSLRQIATSPLLGSEDERDEEGSEKRRSGESDRPIAAMFDAATAERDRVRIQARRAVLKGVGWLLGADEKEIAG